VVVFWVPSLQRELPRLKKPRQENLHKNKVEYYVQVHIKKYMCECAVWHLWFLFIFFSLGFMFEMHHTRMGILFTVLCQHAGTRNWLFLHMCKAHMLGAGYKVQFNQERVFTLHSNCCVVMKLFMWIEIYLNWTVVSSLYINICLIHDLFRVVAYSTCLVPNKRNTLVDMCI
jgi:hypothetical protein